MSPPPKTPQPLRAALSATAVQGKVNLFCVPIPREHAFVKYAHGGFCISGIQCAIKEYACKHVPHQPHTFDLHANFIKPVMVGEAFVRIEAVKLGPVTSTLQFTMTQKETKCIVGYATNINLMREKGATFATTFALTPPAPPVDLAKLEDNTDKNWVSYLYEWHPRSLIQSNSHALRYAPVKPVRPDMVEFWIRQLPLGEKFTNEMLGSLVDQYPRFGEAYHNNNAYSAQAAQERGLQQQRGQLVVLPGIMDNPLNYWYPTVSLSFELKKALPAEGVTWLYLRATTKKFEKGRFDSEVVVMDEHNDIVALSHQVSFAIATKTDLKPAGPAQREMKGGPTSKL